MSNLRWKIAQWFEKKWWNNYLSKKNPEKYIIWKKDYWRKFFKDISINFNGNENILDVGCGPAGTFILSNEIKSNKWVALDPLLENYKTLSIFKKENYPKVVFENIAFEEYNKTTTFDTILCLNAINHFINIDSNLIKLYKLLKKDKELILSIDAHNYTFLKWVLYSIPLDILHPHQYTDVEYEKMFLNKGFTIVKKKLIKKEFIFSYYVYVLKK